MPTPPPTNCVEVILVAPGDDLTPEDSQVKTIGEALHTPEVIAAFRAAQEAVLEG